MCSHSWPAASQATYICSILLVPSFQLSKIFPPYLNTYDLAAVDSVSVLPSAILLSIHLGSLPIAPYSQVPDNPLSTAPLVVVPAVPAIASVRNLHALPRSVALAPKYRTLVLSLFLRVGEQIGPRKSKYRVLEQRYQDGRRH